MEYEKYMLTYIKRFMDKHYNYAYLKGMLGTASRCIGNKRKLITGSSYALCGIDSSILTNSYNCSMNSQDIYYNFKCGKSVLDVNAKAFSKCFIVMGYYTSCQDLSKSSKVGREMITRVYYPIFADRHHLDDMEEIDIYAGLELSDEFAKRIEEKAIERIIREGNYYNFYKKRKPYIKLDNEKKWWELDEEVKLKAGEKRANSHSKIKYKGSYDENKEIFKDYIHYLTMKDINPIVVVTPYTKYYNEFLDKEQKEMFIELLNVPSKKIDYIDFNDCNLFDDYDFVDTDHLNETGAKKISRILAEIF